MTTSQSAPHPSFARLLAKSLSVLLFIAFAGSFAAAQNKSATQPKAQANTPQAAANAYPDAMKEILSNPELMTELGRIIKRFQNDIQYPTPRNESRLLALEPDSTVGYAAFPNYGDVAHQALDIFHEELKSSAALRDWYQRRAGATGPKVEAGIAEFYEFSQFIGPEVALSVSADLKHPNVAFAAEIRKPGLRAFIEQIRRAFPPDHKSNLILLDPQEFAAKKDSDFGKDDNPVLIRPDFLVGASDVATLRAFNARLDRRAHEFASTPFGTRIEDAYHQGTGVTTLAAADLLDILKQSPQLSANDRSHLEQSGFSDVKYFVADQRKLDGQALGEWELSFTSPRHGPAAWLAAPRQPGSLDFVSPQSAIAFTLMLVDPSKIFDDVHTLNPDASVFATLPQFEKAMNLSFKDDLLGQLTGELTIEVDSVSNTKPAGRLILGVKDAARLQNTLATVLVTSPMAVTPSKDGGFDSYTLVPPGNSNLEVAYAFIDNYLVIALGHAQLLDAVRLHKSGGSLGRSKEFLATLPKGHPSGISGLFFENPATAAGISLAQMGPDLAGAFSKLGLQRSEPVVACLYGEPTAIRSVGSSVGLSGAALIAAAVAVPNMLRARTAANEASAVSDLRTVNTAQGIYSSLYPKRGFASDLATLGPGPDGGAKPNADHSALIDASIGGITCTTGAWCAKSGYRFTLSARCQQQLCLDYVVTAAPVDTNTGKRSFCTTSDGVVRRRTLETLDTPVSIKQCQSWQPVE